MNISLILLRTGEYLISQVEELQYEPKVHLTTPYLVSGKTKVTLKMWPDHCTDTHVLLHSESLMTVLTPLPEVRAAYLKKIGMTEEDLTEASKPVILNEDNQDWVDDDNSEYEPRYVEEPLQ
jgi:hypothetical protein